MTVSVTSPALPDTRAQIMAGMVLVHKLGDTRNEPSPETSRIKAANSEGLKLMEELPAMQLFAEKNAKPAAFHKAFPNALATEGQRAA